VMNEELATTEPGLGPDTAQPSEADSVHPASFNESPQWVAAVQLQLLSLLRKHGFLILAVIAVALYLAPGLRRRLREAAKGPPITAASAITQDGDASNAAAASGDTYAEQRRAAVERLQAKLEEESAAALKLAEEQRKAEAALRLQQLDEEAKRMGMHHLVGRGHRLGSEDDGGGGGPPLAPAQPAAPSRPAASIRPSQPYTRRGFNPMDGGGGVGGFRSTRNVGRG